MKTFIERGDAAMGIEFGSTRIKVVLIDDKFSVIGEGAHDWDNELSGGIWSYSMEAVETGLRDAYAKCAADVESKYGAKITRLKALGISGMMHGYLPFDANGNILVPFRTWRNVMTGQAAAELSELFKFNIPQRWSIAHYYQAMLNNEPHIQSVDNLTTLAGYVHRRLSGENVLGVGEASGMFPVDPATGTYNARMVAAFNAKTGGDIIELLPRVLRAGECAGTLTDEGAKWLDPSGVLQAGALMAPPEGDAGTGMVATNAVAPRTGNVSAGTSIFAMAVLDEPMKGYYPEIDVVTTPTGLEVAMVHCNNCTNEINAWSDLFRTAIDRSSPSPAVNVYDILFNESLNGDADCGGIVVVPFLSGEPVTGVEDAMLRVVRKPGTNFTLANFARANIYSAFAALKLGMEKLSSEGITIDMMMGHGGIFKTPGVAQQYLADALKTPVACMKTASEGGPWGMAVLAAYASRRTEGETAKLEDFLAKSVFAGAEFSVCHPIEEGVAGFAAYVDNFKEAIHA